MAETATKKKWKLNYGYIFIAPWVLGFLFFMAIPIVSNVLLSFTNWKLLGDVKFTGFDNYQALLQDKVFWMCLKNTFIWVIFSNIVVLFSALVVAALLSNDFKGNYLLRTIIYLPGILPPVAFGVVVGYLFSGSPNAIVNRFLSVLGISPQGWFTNPVLALPTAIATMLWFIGTPMLIYLAAIKGISPSYYDAARIDGANAISKFFRVTIPLISPAIVFNTVMGVINGWQVYENILPYTTAADSDFLAQAYGRDYSLGVVLIHIHERGFRHFELGYAAAIGLVLFIIVVIITAICFQVIYKNKSYYQEFGE